MINPSVIGALSKGVETPTYPGALASFSLRNLRYPVQKVVRIRRDSDNAESNFKSREVIDGTLESFVGAGNGYVAKWFDQSGNGRDAVQSTASKQPILVSSGTLLREGGRPIIKPYDGNSELLISGLAGQSSFWGFFVLREDSVASPASLLLNGDAWNDYVVNSLNGDTVYVTYSNAGSPIYVINGTIVTFANRDDVHTQLTPRCVFLLLCNTSTWTQTKFGYSFSAGFSMMNMQEAIIYNTNPAVGWPTVMASMNNYYNLY